MPRTDSEDSVHASAQAHYTGLSKFPGDPTCSFWLREAHQGLIRRDPVDAVNDAEMLLQLARTRLEAVMEAHGITAYERGRPG